MQTEFIRLRIASHVPWPKRCNLLYHTKLHFSRYQTISKHHQVYLEISRYLFIRMCILTITIKTLQEPWNINYQLENVIYKKQQQQQQQQKLASLTVFTLHFNAFTWNSQISNHLTLQNYSLVGVHLL